MPRGPPKLVKRVEEGAASPRFGQSLGHQSGTPGTQRGVTTKSLEARLGRSIGSFWPYWITTAKISLFTRKYALFNTKGNKVQEGVPKLI